MSCRVEAYSAPSTAKVHNARLELTWHQQLHSTHFPMTPDLAARRSASQPVLCPRRSDALYSPPSSHGRGLVEAIFKTQSETHCSVSGMDAESSRREERPRGVRSGNYQAKGATRRQRKGKARRGRFDVGSVTPHTSPTFVAGCDER